MPGSHYPDLDPIDYITPRQRQILIHLIRGKTREVIAKELFLSRSTVNRDVREMTFTLGASSPEALGALAYRAGFLGEEHLLELAGPRAARIGAAFQHRSDR